MHKTPSLRKSDGNNALLQNQESDHQDRRAKVLMLHSKGYSQSEIAVKLDVNQSTISRDLAEIRKKARSSLDLYVKDEIPNEFQIYISGLNQITKNLWEMVEDDGNSKTTKEKVYILTLLMQCYSKRIEMLVGGPNAKMNARKHMHDIQYDETHPWMNQ